jgi:hypothetical protein
MFKYLKKFESEEYYSKVDRRNNISIPFGPDNIRVINIANKYGYSVWNSNIDEVVSLRKIGRPFLNIYKNEDEWYFVLSESGKEMKIQFWKCDQLDGLEKLIKDINIGLVE